MTNLNGTNEPILIENEAYYYQSNNDTLQRFNIKCYDIIKNNIASDIFNGEEKIKIIINDLVVNNNSNMFFNVLVDGIAYELSPMKLDNLNGNIDNSTSYVSYNVEKLIDDSYKFKKLWIYLKK